MGKNGSSQHLSQKGGSLYSPDQSIISSYGKKGVGRLPCVHFSGFSCPFVVFDFSLSDAGLCTNED